MFSGAQFSIYAMSDDFVEVILGGVQALGSPEDLRIETDEVSTLLVGTPKRVFEGLEVAYAQSCRLGSHVVLQAHISRGCPGEPDDPLCTPVKASGKGESGERPDPKTIAPLGIPVNAQYSLYPLATDDYMEIIAAEIDYAKQAGVFDCGKHFCSKLRGDLAVVLAHVYGSFERAAERAGHVVIQLTVSKGSPSEGAA